MSVWRFLRPQPLVPSFDQRVNAFRIGPMRAVQRGPSSRRWSMKYGGRCLGTGEDGREKTGSVLE
jgi:hypothetical protein